MKDGGNLRKKTTRPHRSAGGKRNGIISCAVINTGAHRQHYFMALWLNTPQHHQTWAEFARCDITMMAHKRRGMLPVLNTVLENPYSHSHTAINFPIKRISSLPCSAFYWEHQTCPVQTRVLKLQLRQSHPPAAELLQWHVSLFLHSVIHCVLSWIPISVCLSANLNALMAIFICFLLKLKVFFVLPWIRNEDTWILNSVRAIFSFTNGVLHTNTDAFLNSTIFLKQTQMTSSSLALPPKFGCRALL